MEQEDKEPIAKIYLILLGVLVYAVIICIIVFILYLCQQCGRN